MKDERYKYEDEDTHDLFMNTINNESFINHLNHTTYRVYEVTYKEMKFIITIN